MTSSRRERKFPRTQTFCLFILLLSALLLTPSSAQESQDDDDVVRVDTDLVVLNATVVDAKGKYAHGLGRSDFKVLEDGREQAISDFGVEETPFAAAVLLDTSGSVEGQMTLARSAAIRFMDQLRPDDVVAVYRFDNEVEQVQEFSSSHDLSPVVFGFRAGGMTALNKAVFRAAEDLAQRPEKRRAIVLLSDGFDAGSEKSAGEALDRALTAGVTIYTVNMATLEQRRKFGLVGAVTMQNFAAKSGGRYVTTPGGASLREAFAAIVEELSNQYTISYRPSNRARDGRWRSVEVKLNTQGMNIRTRKGYRAPKA
ncbi:MAG: VWA domain-containing protein [Pyrinomonadaceae bacterium]